MNFTKPKILVSKCLGFAHCRYNGQILYDDFIGKLSKFCEVITTCPEEEIGLGTPRFPIRLVESEDKKILFQASTKKDFTEKINFS